MRKITIYSTKGASGVINTEAKTWGEIVSEVRNIVGDLSNLKATENVNKTTLEHVDAVLPEGDFRLFLRPVKTKSGVDFYFMSFKELRAYIAEQGQLCKDYLNTAAKKSGRNWTQLSADEMKDLLSNYSGNTTTQTTITNKIISKKETVKIEEKKPTTDVNSVLEEVLDAVDGCDTCTVVNYEITDNKIILIIKLGDSNEIDEDALEEEFDEMMEGFI